MIIFVPFKGYFLYGDENYVTSDILENPVPGLTLYKIPEYMNTHATCITTKNSPYKKILDLGLLKLGEMGTLEHVRSAIQST